VSTLFARYVFFTIFILLGGILLTGAGIYLFSLFEWVFKSFKINILEKSILESTLILASLFVVSLLYGVLLSVISPTQKKIIPLLAAFIPSIPSLIVLSMSPLMQGMLVLSMFIGIYLGFYKTGKPNNAINNIAD
jgi:hypothetical protein